MSSLIDEYQKRLDIVNGVAVEEDSNLKVFTVRLPLSLIEGLEDCGSFVGMKRTEIARMILTHGVEEIKNAFGLKVEKYGITFEEQYAIETGEKTLEEVLKSYEQEERENE